VYLKSFAEKAQSSVVKLSPEEFAYMVGNQFFVSDDGSFQQANTNVVLRRSRSYCPDDRLTWKPKPREDATAPSLSVEEKLACIVKLYDEHERRLTEFFDLCNKTSEQLDSQELQLDALEKRAGCSQSEKLC